jgi:hypothetical protein
VVLYRRTVYNEFEINSKSISPRKALMRVAFDAEVVAEGIFHGGARRRARPLN